ncbi:MAG: hypothetical protein LKH04_11985 [Lachnospiraceae bacterium]|jgi:hypothetical protein|nr:hypothetical protein [Lachnospiraceae bacterium]MCI1424982.1 hypothetical protein [Lachnospiraceae bacterium]MCI1453686.1 hypothetical protein [Lachnospiraceae bacterium]
MESLLLGLASMAIAALIGAGMLAAKKCLWNLSLRMLRRDPRKRRNRKNDQDYR